MGWPQAHRYYAALRELEDMVNTTDTAVLPWHEYYAEIFGDRRGLLLALWRRWQVLVQAQVGETGGLTLDQLVAAHPGLVRILAEHASELGPLPGIPGRVTVEWGGAA